MPREVQKRLEGIWARLQCPEAQQMDMAIKYSSHLSNKPGRYIQAAVVSHLASQYSRISSTLLYDGKSWKKSYHYTTRLRHASGNNITVLTTHAIKLQALSLSDFFKYQ